MTESKKKSRLGFWSVLLLTILTGSLLGLLPKEGQSVPLALLFLWSVAAFLLWPRLLLLPSRRACAGAMVGLFLVFAGLNGEKIAANAEKARETREAGGVTESPAAAANKKAKTEGEEKNQQRLFIIVTQDGVRSRLKDPASAEFRNVLFKRHEGTPIVCGEVNSKNGFGGYTGFQHFVGAGEDLVYLEEEVSDFAQVWNEMCAK